MKKNALCLSSQLYWKKCTLVEFCSPKLKRTPGLYVQDISSEEEAIFQNHSDDRFVLTENQVVDVCPNDHTDTWNFEPVDYDKIANVYDDLFNDEDSKKEEHEIVSLISKSMKTMSVVDIGSGSGLLLDLFEIPAYRYTGIDPSAKMTGALRSKHPAYHVESREAEECDINDNAFYVSLFGSASYVNPSVIHKIVNSGFPHFLMFYAEDYIPSTYIKTGVSFRHIPFSNYWGVKARRLGNYMVVSNIE